MCLSPKKTFKRNELGGRILNNTGVHVGSIWVQSRFEDVSRWSFDSKDRLPVPGSNNLNGEGDLPTVQLETSVVQF